MAPGTPRKDVTTQFQAMGSPCVVLVDTDDIALGVRAGEIVSQEALRIHAKYSRYRPSVVTTINQSVGQDVELDQESADLIDYAVTCYELSEGRFDITSGALRRVWRFDGTGTAPDAAAVLQILPLVGWHRVFWNRPVLRLPAGMEIDLGGIGKEYAVDRALLLARAETDAPLLVNFGGDLRVSGARADGSPWHVAIEDVDQAGATSGLLDISHGALATSGDSYRYVKEKGVRYGHVLDPRSGWPIPNAPRSVTVHAATCSEAGLLAKLALLRGAEAEAFLREEQVHSWCVR
jgi:thiamine biosynthesis lipoprotein